MPTKPPSFSVTREDRVLIQKIAERAVGTAAADGVDYDMMTAELDITACHANGTPLRLRDLLRADDANFGHDMYGIRRFIDRETGELTGHFSPRFAQPQGAT